MRMFIGMLLNIIAMVIISLLHGNMAIFSKDWWFMILVATIFNIAGYISGKEYLG